MSKAADIVVSTLNKAMVDPFFVVPGEANVHLLDAIGRYEGLSFIRMQSEKSASQALEASGKYCQNQVLIVSSGQPLTLFLELQTHGLIQFQCW